MSIVESIVRELANIGWDGFQALNARFADSPSPEPTWAPGPLLKSHERSKPPLGWPRETDSLCPRCVIETRARNPPRRARPRRSGRRPRRRDQGADRRGRTGGSSSGRRARSTAPSRTSSRSIPRFSSLIEQRYHGPRLPHARRRARPPARDVDHQVRPRDGPHDRPDQPLQHDVQPVLHGREPGRVRPRADARRDQGDPRRVDLVQAAAADDRAVLRRRADDVAALPRGVPVRQGRRLLQCPGGDQRHPLRARARVRVPGEGGRVRSRLLPVRRRHQRRQQPPAHHEPLRRQAAGHRRRCTPRASRSSRSPRWSTA